MFRGEVRFTVPMPYSLAFIMTFVLRGVTGIVLAIPPLDYVFHTTRFFWSRIFTICCSPPRFMECWPRITIGFPRRSASGLMSVGGGGHSPGGLRAFTLPSCRSMFLVPAPWHPRTVKIFENDFEFCFIPFASALSFSWQHLSPYLCNCGSASATAKKPG